MENFCYCVLVCLTEEPNSTLVKPFILNSLRPRPAVVDRPTRNYDWVMSQGADVVFFCVLLGLRWLPEARFALAKLDCWKLDFVMQPLVACLLQLPLVKSKSCVPPWLPPRRRLRYVKLLTTKSSDAEIPLHLAAQQGLVDAGQHGNGKCPGSNGRITAI